MSDNDELERSIDRLESRVEDLTLGANNLVFALREYFAAERDLQKTEPLERLIDAFDEVWSQLP